MLWGACVGGTCPSALSVGGGGVVTCGRGKQNCPAVRGWNCDLMP